MTNISLLDMKKTKKRNVRESIIAVLGRKFPLSMRKIFNEINKEYKLGVTYQAVFKLIKEMTQECILKKEDKEYMLNIDWITQLEDEIKIIKGNYASHLTVCKQDSKEIKDRIEDFIMQLGPVLKNYIGNDKSCIITLSGTGYYYALNLWKYLQREGKDVRFVEIKKMDLTAGKRINLYIDDFENRKVLVVDYGIFSGSIYKSLIEMIKPLRNKFKIKDVKFIVDIDLIGLADFAITKTSVLNNKRII
jgi:hypothetical protein